MNRRALERYMRGHGCQRDHEGGRHTIWINLRTGAVSQVPRHPEIPPGTVRNICQALGIPLPPGR